MSEFAQVKWDWADTKVHPAVRYPSSWVSGGQDSGAEDPISMVKSFNIRISTPKDVAGSYNQANQGFITKHPEYYVDITCNPYGDGYERLLSCMNGDRYFDVVLAPITNYMTDPSESTEVGQPSVAWGPTLEVMKACKVLDLNERYNMGTEPTVTFSCRALRFVWDEGQYRREFGDNIMGRTMKDEDLGL